MVLRGMEIIRTALGLRGVGNRRHLHVMSSVTSLSVASRTAPMSV